MRSTAARSSTKTAATSRPPRRTSRRWSSGTGKRRRPTTPPARTRGPERRTTRSLWLNKSIELGFDAERYLRHDDDLDSLRKDPRFAELKKAARAAKAEGRRRPRGRPRAFERLAAGRHRRTAPALVRDGLGASRRDQLDLVGEGLPRRRGSLGYRVAASTYNAACALARAGRKAEALDALQKSIELGYTDARHIEGTTISRISTARSVSSSSSTSRRTSPSRTAFERVHGELSSSALERGGARSRATRRSRRRTRRPGSRGRTSVTCSSWRTVRRRPSSRSARPSSSATTRRRPSTTSPAPRRAPATRTRRSSASRSRSTRASTRPSTSATTTTSTSLHGDPRPEGALARAKARKSDEQTD